jgi:WD40 repeat protein
MPKPAFQRVEELFHRAVALAPAERPGFLDGACAGDADLRAAVEDLLRRDRAGRPTESYLVSPVAREADLSRQAAPTLPGAGQGHGGPSLAALPHVPGYKVFEELGRGGMGVVYKARQVSLNRLVALKMLPAAPATTEQVGRFRAEAEALARLHNPNIVPVYDIGECEGRPYFTMAYVAGPNLAQVLDGRPQDAPASARLIEVLARSIHAAHECGIIHRDLKPANVLLERRKNTSLEDRGRDGTRSPSLAEYDPRITDFGLAKDQSSGRRLTQSGTVMGTPCYMAPEQVRSSPAGVGPAADVYALGSILYEMLTGRPPFDAASPAETITQLLHDEPLSPSRLRPRLPRDLVTICLKCLEKSPRRRYASAWDLAEDLRRFLADEPIRARPAGLAERAFRWCRRRPLVTALAALSAVLAVAFVSVLLRYIGLQRATIEQESEEIVQLNILIGVSELEAGDSFDALLHFTECLRLDEGHPERERNDRTRIATVLQSCPRLLRLMTFEKPVLCAQPVPPGIRVATAGADGVVEVWEVETGKPTGPGLRHDTAPLDGAFSPDGRSLATTGADGAARIWDLGTGKFHTLPAREGGAVRELVFHAGGGFLVARHADASLRLWDLQGPEPRLRPKLSGLAVSEDGRWLCTLGPGPAGQVWDVATEQPAGPPLEPGPGVMPTAVSGDGGRVAFLSPDNTLRVWDVAAARALGMPIKLPGAPRRVAFSADSDHVVTIDSDGVARAWRIRTAELLAVSPAGSQVTQARFSPDGRRMATADAAGGARVWDATTGRAVTPPLRHGGVPVAVAFSADGKQLVTVGKGGTVCVWELPNDPGTHPGASADEGPTAEDRLVPAAPRLLRLGDGTTVQVKRASAGGSLRRPQGADGVVEGAAFSPDGRRVVVLGNDGVARMWETATGGPAATSWHQAGAVYAAFSPDGLRLLTAGEDRTVRLWDAVRGEILSPPRRQVHAIRHAFFRPDGNAAVVVCEGGAVDAWDLTPDTRPAGELGAIAQVLSCSRIEGQQHRALDVKSLHSTWKQINPGR